jgi:hypothetical protein
LLAPLIWLDSVRLAVDVADGTVVADDTVLALV